MPFNRRYGEMTSEQQAAIRDQVVDMAPDDEPPFPVDGLQPIVEAIAQGQRQLEAVGPMTLVVDVDADGRPTAVAVYRAPDDRTGTFVARLLMVQQYKPARCAGQPCAMAFRSASRSSGGERRARRAGHSALTCPSLTIFAHLAISARWKSPNCAGVIGTFSTPIV